MGIKIKFLSFKKFLFPALLFGGAFLLHSQEAVLFGRLGEEGELIFPRQIEEGPDGNIYIYDQMDAFIKVFDGQGTFIGKIGGKGQGPGEIQRADGVSFGFMPDGKLFFTEFFGGHPWISVMETSGEFVRAVKLDMKERSGIRKAYSLPDGRFLAQFFFIGHPEQTKDYFLHKNRFAIVILDSNGHILSEILKMERITHLSFLDQGGDSPVPFTPGYYWGLLNDRSVLFSEGLSTELQVFNMKGSLTRMITTPLPDPEKVTKSDLDNWRERRKEMMEARNPDWYNRLGRVIEQYKKSIYTHKPNISGLEVTPEGNFLLTGPWDENQRSQMYWLVDSSGKEKAKVCSGVLIGRLTENFILYATMDKDGVSRIFGLERQGSEEEDLLRIPQTAFKDRNFL